MGPYNVPLAMFGNGTSPSIEQFFFLDLFHNEPLIKIGPLFLHSFSPYLDAFLIPFLPSGRCAVDHSSSFWIKAGVIFPSPAPKPALSPAGEAPLGQRPCLLWALMLQSPRSAAPPPNSHPQKERGSFKAGPLPSTLPSAHTQTKAH